MEKSARQKKIESLVSEVIVKVEVTDEGVERLFERSDGFKEELATLINRYTAKPPDFTLAREILGDDFLAPEEIATARSLTYSEEQVVKLDRTLPDREILEWLKRNDYMLVAGSPGEMSLLDVRELNRSYFYSKQDGWYAKRGEEFARNEKVTCRWYMVRKGIVPDSTNKTWSEQQHLLSGLETAPMAVELTWALISYKAVRDVFLLSTLYARTSSVDSCGNHVCVGYFGEDGLNVLSWFDDAWHSRIGVASARKS
jgi:hypothetical protein